MRILIDTNAVLDTFLVREPHNQYSDEIFDLVADNIITGYVNASSITDIYYVLRKKFNDTDSRNKIETLLDVLHVIGVTKSELLTALKSSIPDFEDALVTACAEKTELDYIVTRDREFLNLPIAISPQDFLAKFANN